MPQTGIYTSFVIIIIPVSRLLYRCKATTTKPYAPNRRRRRLFFCLLPAASNQTKWITATYCLKLELLHIFVSSLCNEFGLLSPHSCLFFNPALIFSKFIRCCNMMLFRWCNPLLSSRFTKTCPVLPHLNSLYRFTPCVLILIWL